MTYSETNIIKKREKGVNVWIYDKNYIASCILIQFVYIYTCRFFNS